MSEAHVHAYAHASSTITCMTGKAAHEANSKEGGNDRDGPGIEGAIKDEGSMLIK